jgi:TonB family protein
MMRRSLALLTFIFVLLLGLAVAQTSSSPSPERKVVARSTPVYPELAKKMHIHGVVRIEATIRPNGQVKSTRVMGGNPVLVDAASQAVERWKFEPGQAETTQVVQLTFEEDAKP